MPAENILLKVGCQLWVASNTMDNVTAELNQRLASCQKETKQVLQRLHSLHKLPEICAALWPARCAQAS